MEVKVIQPCSDNVTYKMYEVGEIINLPDERASKAIARGLVVAMVEEKKVETKPTKKVTKKRTKEE